MDAFTWGDASLTYMNWTGTAALDQSMTKDSLEALVGLDEKQWTIIGIDIGHGEHSYDLRVVAIPRDEHDARNLQEVARDHGGVLRATEFKVLGADPYEILRRISNLFEMRLRVASLEGVEIAITDQGDLFGRGT